MDRYETVRRALLPLGVLLPDEPERLGSGCYASAYATACGRVVKITGDREERFAALLAKQNPQPHLVRVEHVFALGGDTVMVVERLKPLPPEIRASWYRPSTIAVVDSRRSYGPQICRNSPYGGKQWSPAMGPEHCWFTNAAPTEIAWRVFDALVGITDSLRAAGITECTDMHQWNVMVRPATGQIVLSDLGCTNSSQRLEALPLPQPGIEGGDPGDCHVDPPKPKAPELAPIKAPARDAVRWQRDEVIWNLDREVKDGELFRVRAGGIDRKRGVVRLERMPEKQAANDQSPVPRGVPKRADGLLEARMREVQREIERMQSEVVAPAMWVEPNPQRETPPRLQGDPVWARAKELGRCPACEDTNGCPVNEELKRRMKAAMAAAVKAEPPMQQIPRAKKAPPPGFPPWAEDFDVSLKAWRRWPGPPALKDIKKAK